MKITVVIPVYNERLTIEEVLRRVQAAPIDKNIIIVDDASTDGTREIVRQFDQENIRILLHPENRGKGASLRTGFAHVDGDIVIIQDGDLEYQPDDYEKLIAPIVDEQALAVYGSRFLGDIENMQILNRIANIWLTWLTNILFGTRITDACTCYKVFRRDVVAQMDLSANGFEICHELTAEVVRLNYCIKEVPIRYSARKGTAGKKVRWTQFFKSTWALLYLKWQYAQVGAQLRYLVTARKRRRHR